MTEYIVIVGGVPQPINVEAGQVLNFQEATYSSSLKAAQELAGSHEYPEAKLKEDKVLVCGKAESNSSLVNLMQAKKLIALVLVNNEVMPGCSGLGCAFCEMVIKNAE